MKKGYQATSIQDILDDSGISKGTFYNYFPSKSELFKAVFLFIQKKHEVRRNELLIGEDLADKEIFIKQIDLYVQSNKTNKLFSLIEEVFFSNDPDLKQFIKESRILQINWVFQRFKDLFGLDKSPYLLDCAVIFSGMLQHMFHFHHMANPSSFHYVEVIRYCVERITHIVEDVSRYQIQMLQPELLNKWAPDQLGKNEKFHEDIIHLSTSLQKKIHQVITDETKLKKYVQTVEFIEEELINSKSSRTFLLESSLLLLDTCQELKDTDELSKLKDLLNSHVFSHQ